MSCRWRPGWQVCGGRRWHLTSVSQYEGASAGQPDNIGVGISRPYWNLAPGRPARIEARRGKGRHWHPRGVPGQPLASKTVPRVSGSAKAATKNRPYAIIENSAMALARDIPDEI